MIVFFILIALFVAWIWVDYFRLIDIFEKNNLFYAAFVFILGACSVSIVFLVQKHLLYPSGWRLNGGFINDFGYSIFGIGLVEEIAKITPFLLFHGLFRKKLREPIDYLAFVCVSALGFSAAENVMYFTEYGSHLIISRSILCSISHMFDTAILGYGFILLRFNPNFKNPLIIFGFLFLAALSHGIYDFWLLYEGFNYGTIVTLLFYFVTISIFATIINNSLNNSAHFTYKKGINTDFLINRMFAYYGIVLLAQVLLITYEKGLSQGVFSLISAVFFSGLIVIVSILRLSRFTLIKGQWKRIKFELPFHFRGGKSTLHEGWLPFGIRIKGPSHNEAFLATLFEEYVQLMPVKNSIGQSKLGFIEKKISIREDEVHYILRLYQSDKNSSFETILIQPKTGRNSHTKSNHPIVARMDIVEIMQNGKLKKKYRFVEWVYIRKAPF
jgi:RsiW-degrading membrane proteinase PrsW (M82 family)